MSKSSGRSAADCTDPSAFALGRWMKAVPPFSSSTVSTRSSKKDATTTFSSFVRLSLRKEFDIGLLTIEVCVCR